MEYLDILNQKTGLPTGEKRERKEVHQKGLWHKVVHIWILNSKGEFLIQKRSPTKITYPNMWVMSCEGHSSTGDSSQEAAIRELSEELGLDVPVSDLKFLFSYKREAQLKDDYIARHFIDVYLIQKDILLSELNLQTDEVSEVDWISVSDYKKKIKASDPTFRNYPNEFPRLFDEIKKIINVN